MKILEFEQRSPEWYKARAGVCTASEMDKIITTKGEPSKQAKKYLYRLAGEFVSGICEEAYQSAAMLKGIEMEAEAREMYSVITGNEVKEVGFCLHDTINCGCSPDGLVGEDGGLEIKNPSTPVHVEYLLGGVLPTDYFQQVQTSLFVTGRKWWDFMSYSAGIKPLIVRVTPDKAFHACLERELIVFCKELETIINKIK